MAKRALLGLLLGVTAVACGKGAPEAPPDPYLAGFNPPAVASGYTRYVTPVVTIPAGGDQLWCQYVSAPFTQDQLILDVMGEQSTFGHHIVVYATTTGAPIGTSRACTNQDMLSVRFLGAIGGEGNAHIVGDLPPGVAFSIHAGETLMFNTHFINTSSQSAQGEGVVDVKFAPPSPQYQTAGFFTNVDTQFQLQPAESGPQSADTSCKVQQDMNFFLIGEHMHSLGYSAFTEVIHADGTKQPVVADPTWTPEMQFNPVMTPFPESSPFAIHAGDTVHTHCEWINSGASVVGFPTEMCVTFGFFLPGGGPELDCVDGQWPSGS
ncbi:MAG: hypothetical protein ACYCWW_08860 [Deltaproteobacteria bacterium]